VPGGSYEDFADCFFDFVYFCVAETLDFGEVAFCGCLDGVDGADTGRLEFGNVCCPDACCQQKLGEVGMDQSFGVRRRLRSPVCEIDGESGYFI